MAIIATKSNPAVLKAVQKVTQIATLPEVTTKIIQLVEDPRSTAKDLQDIIKHDIALSAKILKVVNSAFYGLPKQISSIDRAIILLGLSTVKNIAVATSMIKVFGGAGISKRFTAKDLWQHSLACGVFCKVISQVRSVENSDEIFVAGLMHDLGLIVEKQVYPDELSNNVEKAFSEGADICEIERESLGADHQEYGLCLSTKWKFPTLFQLSTGYHHQPLKASKHYTEVAATVHLADVLAYKKQIGFYFETVPYDSDVLDILKLTKEQVGDIFSAFDEKFEVAENVMR